MQYSKIKDLCLLFSHALPPFPSLERIADSTGIYWAIVLWVGRGFTDRRQWGVGPYFSVRLFFLSPSTSIQWIPHWFQVLSSWGSLIFIGLSAQKEGRANIIPYNQITKRFRNFTHHEPSFWGDSCLLLLTLRVQRRHKRALETELLLPAWAKQHSFKESIRIKSGLVSMSMWPMYRGRLSLWSSFGIRRWF